MAFSSFIFRVRRREKSFKGRKDFNLVKKASGKLVKEIKVIKVVLMKRISGRNSCEFELKMLSSQRAEKKVYNVYVSLHTQEFNLIITI